MIPKVGVERVDQARNHPFRRHPTRNAGSRPHPRSAAPCSVCPTVRPVAAMAQSFPREATADATTATTPGKVVPARTKLARQEPRSRRRHCATPRARKLASRVVPARWRQRLETNPSPHWILSISCAARCRVVHSFGAVARSLIVGYAPARQRDAQTLAIAEFRPIRSRGFPAVGDRWDVGALSPGSRRSRTRGSPGHVRHVEKSSWRRFTAPLPTRGRRVASRPRNWNHCRARGWAHTDAPAITAVSTAAWQPSSHTRSLKNCARRQPLGEIDRQPPRAHDIDPRSVCAPATGHPAARRKPREGQPW